LSCARGANEFDEIEWDEAFAIVEARLAHIADARHTVRLYHGDATT